MKIIPVTSFFLAALCSVGALAQSARPSDGQVEKLIEQTQKSAATFERALDSKLKKSTVRGPSGEVAVDVFLEDFQTDIERLKERFVGKYSASAEVVAVIRRGTGLATFIDSQPPSLKGRSEWDSFSASLNELAGAYGSSFPMKADNPPRRMNDLEIQEAADAAVKNGQTLRKSLSSVYGKEDKEGVKAAEANIDAMTKAAKGLKARVDDEKPASGEAAVFVESVSKVKSALGERTLTGDAKTSADGIKASQSKVEQAFGMQAKPVATPVAAAAPAVVPVATPTATPAAEPVATAAAAAAPGAVPGASPTATPVAEPLATPAVAAAGTVIPATEQPGPAGGATPVAEATATSDVAATATPVAAPAEK